MEQEYHYSFSCYADDIATQCVQDEMAVARLDEVCP